MLSHPIDRQNIFHPKPNYIIYEFDPPSERYQHDYLQTLKDPQNSEIPESFENIYYSDKTGIIFVVYKINHDDSGV